MTSERTDRETAAEEEESAGDRVVSVAGTDVVIEEDLIAFPWRAGIRRAPAAFGATLLALLALIAATGGLGDVPVADQLASVGVVAYNAHNIHAAVGNVPGFLMPAVEVVSKESAIFRPLRGLFTVGTDHGKPLDHLLGILSGETGAIGHVNLIEQQGDTTIPKPVYYLLPIGVLVATGYEFAARYWDQAATDSPLEVVRFGVAIGIGYVATLLVGTLPFTLEMQSALVQGTFLVFPDRFMVVIFGFFYPAVFASLGAGIVYLRGGPAGEPEDDDAPAEEPVAADGGEQRDGAA